MFELGLFVVVCVGMGKLASADGQSGIVWGALTAALAAAAVLYVPFPFLRVLGVAVAAFLGFIAFKVIARK